VSFDEQACRPQNTGITINCCSAQAGGIGQS
jgi:hypothetical protein